MVTDEKLVSAILESPWERAVRQAALDNAFFMATVADEIPEEYVLEIGPDMEVDP